MKRGFVVFVFEDVFLFFDDDGYGEWLGVNLLFVLMF